MVGRNSIRGSKEAQFAKREAGLRMLSLGKYTHKEIAEALNVSHGTVRMWSSKVRSGEKSVKTTAKRGRKPGQGKRLRGRDERRIIAMIRDKNPHQLHLEFYLWSVGAVMALIERECGVMLSDSSIRNYLRHWGFTVQRPKTRYTRRDDVIVQNWLDHEYPKIAAQAKAEGAEIHWLDETGVNNQAVYQRGFAPISALGGKTPIIQKPPMREKISLISTVTNLGTMRFSVFEGSLKKQKLIEFLGQLVRETDRKIYVIMDNLPVHKSAEVRAWQQENAQKIKIFYLPPYAPDLNPDEYLNNDLKQNVHKRSGLPLSKSALKSNVRAYLRHIQKSPAKVMSYFQTSQTLYAA